MTQLIVQTLFGKTVEFCRVRGEITHLLGISLPSDALLKNIAGIRFFAFEIEYTTNSHIKDIEAYVVTIAFYNNTGNYPNRWKCVQVQRISFGSCAPGHFLHLDVLEDAQSFSFFENQLKIDASGNFFSSSKAY